MTGIGIIQEENTMENEQIKVKSKSKYIVVPKKGFGGDVWGILISIFMIFGGFSGEFVLRGTTSSKALVIVGFFFLAFDIYNFKVKSNLINRHKERVRILHQQEDEVLKNSKQLEDSVPVKVVYDKSQNILAFNPAVNGVSMKKDAKAYCFAGMTTRRKSILNFEALDLTVVFEVNDDSEIVFTLENEKSEFRLLVPSNVTFVADNVAISPSL